MSVATINADMAAARAALLSGDYATALSYALAAQALIAAMPHMVQRDRDELQYDQRGVDQFVRQVRRQQAASAGLQATKLVRRNPVYAAEGES